MVLKGVLAFLLIAASALFSFLAVGAFWWSWGTGGSVEVEGWLIYGSRAHRTPHTLMPLPIDRFQEDLPYDVQVELELVRPTRGADEAGASTKSERQWLLTSPRQFHGHPGVAVVTRT